MAQRKKCITKYEIIKVATEFFLEEGVSRTSPKMISEKLNISTGNITYYFPTKDHLIAVLVEMLCAFYWQMVENDVDENISPIMMICLEFATMVAICEEDEKAKDFYHSAYTSDICLEIIQRNDAKRAQQVFASYCPGWTEERFAEAEAIVSGVEYTALKTNNYSPPLELRLKCALDAILTAFNVPEETRRIKIAKVLTMDYRQIGRRVMKEFKEYVKKTNDQVFDDIFWEDRMKA